MNAVSGIPEVNSIERDLHRPLDANCRLETENHIGHSQTIVRLPCERAYILLSGTSRSVSRHAF